MRDIMHINDLYELIKLQIADFDLFNNRIFNAGGGTDVSVSLAELTAICEDITGNKIKIHSIAENRAADIPIYISDNTLINNTCGWAPVMKPKDILIDIFDWMKTNESTIKKQLVCDLPNAISSLF